MLPQPSVENCSRALSTCMQLAKGVHAQVLRVYMCSRGLVLHTIVGNRLSNSLADTGCSHDVLEGFETLAFSNSLSWDTLVSNSSNSEEPQNTLPCYHRLQVHASLQRNIVVLLKACAKSKDLERGLEIHGEIARSGMHIDAFVGSTLVHLYTNCGLLRKAHKVLEELPTRNVVTWNALMAGYTKFGYGEEALDCFDQMIRERITPDSVSYLCGLKACGICRALERGWELHVEIARKSLLLEDVAVGNTLVDMYVKCGSVVSAQQVFDRLPARNVVTWTNLIAGLAEQGDGKSASKCFQQMRAEGIRPDAIAVACHLKACGMNEFEDNSDDNGNECSERQTSGSNSFDPSGKTAITGLTLDKAKKASNPPWDCKQASQVTEGVEYTPRKGSHCNPEQVHTQETFSSGTACYDVDVLSGEQDIIVSNTLLDMYAKHGLIRKSQKVFDSLVIRDQVSWNILIAGYAEHGYGREALRCYKQMQECGFHPGIVSYVSVLKACCSIGALEVGLKVHIDITKKGLLEYDIVIGSLLVDMYAKCGSLDMAHGVFDLLPVQNVVSWTSLMGGYNRNGYGEEAIQLFDEMQSKGIFPDVATVISLLKACTNVGDTDKAQEIHAEIDRRGLLERDLAIGNTLVDMYAKCGSLSKAQSLFNSLPVHDVVSWNSLISGYAGLGRCEKAVEWLEQMQLEGVSPDAVTYACSLNVCNKIGTLNVSIPFSGVKRTPLPAGQVSVGFDLQIGQL